MEIDEIHTFRQYVGRSARHLWRKVSIVLRSVLRLKKIADHHKQRDQYRLSSSSKAGLMEIDPIDPYAKIDPFLHHATFTRSAVDRLYTPKKNPYAETLFSPAHTYPFLPADTLLSPAHSYSSFPSPAHSYSSLPAEALLSPAHTYSSLPSPAHTYPSILSPPLPYPPFPFDYLEIAPLDLESYIHDSRKARHLWGKVSIVVRFVIRLSLLHHKQRDQYRSSSSSALRSPGKVAYICVWTTDKYEWYAFDVSDDIKHNQTPPPAKYINYPIPFHEDDESGVVNLKPQVTANMDWILGWEILGFKTLYILDDWKGPLSAGESNRVDRIDLSLIGSSRCEWEPVQGMPNQITASAHTCVLGSKFYCLGGRHPSQKVESVGKSRLAMPYYLSLKAGTSPPPPPCLDLDKILSAFKEVPKPCLPSQNMELERQSPWVMAYDMRQKKWESLLDPPCRPVKIDSIFTAAREFPNQCVVVGSPEDGLLQIYHVNAQQWEKQEFKICPKFGPKVLTGPALSVDNKLYWYSVDDLCLVGYDLVTKMWFVGNFPIHDHGECFGVRDVDTPPHLAHLSGDNFCLLWVSVLQHWSMKSLESKDNCISRLHCMKLRVTTGNLHPESGIISLEVSILSCQSYLASGLKFFRGGLVVDGHSRYPGV